jgi:maltooligosyltrehalose trehalohydrolase
MEHLLENTDTRCGAIVQKNGSVRWRVWAPKADRVEVVLITGDARTLHPMIREERGFFSFSKSDVVDGQRYAFSLDGGQDYPDPASRWQPDGVSRPSAVLRTDTFTWSDEGWKGVPRENLVFYELHVGTFTPEGTFNAIVPRLPALRDLGVTALEIMPVGQFPGTRNWGYDGVHPYAPQQSYGGPHELQRLVNTCHLNGLAVFLDVVYNHIGPEGSYLGEYGPYFTDRYRTPWGAAVNYDGRGSHAVRAFILDNVRMWLEDYRFDGLRLDAVHAIYDFGARHILQDIKGTAVRAAQTLGRQVHIVAESDLNDVRLLLPPQRGGYGIDAQWSDDFHHLMHVALTGEQQGYYEDYGAPEQFPQLLENTFVLNGCYSAHRDRYHGGPDAGLPGDRFVVCIQNHDQVGNRAAGERLSTLITPAAQRLAASLLLLAPYLPLLFMGEEYGEEHPFQYFCSFNDPNLIEAVRNGRRREFEAFHAMGGNVPDPQAENTFAASRLTWSWESDPRRSGLRRLYRDLLGARREWPALRDYSERSARVLPDTRSGVILELVRGGRRPEAGGTIQALFNLTAQPQTIPFQNLAKVLWTSEAEHYDGGRRADMAKGCLLPHECMIFGSTDS